jgi:PASTA domain-containing protein
VSGRRPEWLPIALAGALGTVFGLILALALGAGGKTTTRTVTVGGTPQPKGTLIAKTAVPSVIGERLDIAKDRVRSVGFVVKVEGGGVIGVIRDQNWQVTSQDPVAGQLLQTGSTVHLRIERR